MNYILKLPSFPVHPNGDQHELCGCRHLYSRHRKVGEINLDTALAFPAVLSVSKLTGYGMAEQVPGRAINEVATVYVALSSYGK